MLPTGSTTRCTSFRTAPVSKHFKDGLGGRIRTCGDGFPLTAPQTQRLRPNLATPRWLAERDLNSHFFASKARSLLSRPTNDYVCTATTTELYHPCWGCVKLGVGNTCWLPNAGSMVTCWFTKEVLIAVWIGIGLGFRGFLICRFVFLKIDGYEDSSAALMK